MTETSPLPTPADRKNVKQPPLLFDDTQAIIARVENKPWRAVRLLGAAEAVQEGLGTSAFGVERFEDEYQKTISWLHTQMDENAYRASWSEGKAMTLDQAVSYALD